MKKAYVKPEIVFEDFTLTTNIAAGCEAKTELPSWNNCGIDFSGLTVFFDGMQGCEHIQVEKVGGDGEWNKLCYHVFSGGENLFAS